MELTKRAFGEKNLCLLNCGVIFVKIEICGWKKLRDTDWTQIADLQKKDLSFSTFQKLYEYKADALLDKTSSILNKK